MARLKTKKNTIEPLVEALNVLLEDRLDVPIAAISGALKEPLTALEELRLQIVQSRHREAVLLEKYKTAAAGIAHDLKTPLAVIKAYAECITDGMQGKDYPGLISQKVDEMNELVQSLALSAKEDIELAAQSKKEPVDAQSYFNGLLSKFTNLPESKRITFKAKHIPKVQLYVNKQELERVMQNLIANAVKHTGKRGKIKVLFKIKKTSLYVTVKNNGEPIAKENQQFIFDKFYTGDTSRTSGASGLGLYLVKEIIESHSGNIGVRSKKSATSFTFNLPIMMNLLDVPTKTNKFEKSPKVGKLFLLGFFGYLIGFIFRFMRFNQTRRASTMLGAFMALFMPPVFWIVDFITVAAKERIMFLAA